MAKNIYAGVEVDVPIYDTIITTTNKELTYENLNLFFNVNTNNNAIVSSFPGYGEGNSSAPLGGKAGMSVYFNNTSNSNSLILTALVDIPDFEFWPYDDSDLYINGTKMDTSITTGAWSSEKHYSLTAGDVFKYHHTHSGNSYATFFGSRQEIPIETETEAIVGYEKQSIAKKINKLYCSTNNLASKIIKGYTGINNTARSFYELITLNYTGNYNKQMVTVNGKEKTLYSFTTSGTLTISNKSFDIWYCGGGAGGMNGTYVTSGSNSGNGGGGGYFKTSTINNNAKTYTISIGSGGASKESGLSTSISNISTNAEGGNYSGDGGSGGGEGGGTTNMYGAPLLSLSEGGTGAGTSTYPFEITSLYAHCAGGGGGCYEWSGSTLAVANGGNGGANGGNGKSATAGTSSNLTAGAGGEKGGGSGRKTTTTSNIITHATFYGAGGGGGSYINTGDYLEAGSGYQGVAYILIPI